MEIEVTQEDIDKGQKANAFFCPVARACARAGWDDVAVVTECQGTRGSISVYKTNTRGRVVNTVNYDLPKEAASFVYRYDRGEKVEPFRFLILDSKVDSQ